VVLDAVFLRADERERVTGIARDAGARFDGIWLDLDPALAAARIAGRRDDASDATPAVLELQLAATPAAIPGWRRIDSRGAPSQVLARACEAMPA
jgi:predicted kinase